MNIPPSFRRLTRSPAQKAIAVADAHRDARSWTEAAQAYAQALELNPSLVAIRVQYGHALKESGDFDGAEKAYRQALALEGGNADTHLQLGHLLKISGRPQEAAECYLRSLEITPIQPDALREIQDLGALGVHVPADRLQAVLGGIAATAAPSPVDMSMEALAAALDRLKEAMPSAEPDDLSVFADTAARIRSIAQAGRADTGAPDDTVLIFDVSDLIHHFRHSRVPTGIQRVQLEIVASLIRENREPVQICALFRHRWVEIPVTLFMTLVQLSASGSDTGAADWRHATTHLEIILGSAAPLRFPAGACLINLGTSWHVDYLLQIRNAKRESQIRYIPFVHDLIPIVAPQFVLESVTQDFVGWLLAVFDHADLFLTNSQSTRRDLIAQAARLGHTLPEKDVVVVPLDARFTSPPDDRGSGAQLLRKQGLHGQPFVLMVGTIEPRKNHLAAIDAWAELLAKADGRATPTLVCVGGRGWLNEDVRHRVSANAVLSEHVRFLHDLSDVELAACYDACLFTIYPSFYEGWGLPVTESLCRGKVPLLSDASSLPEAGGVFAEYFPIGVQPAFVAALERLIHDSGRRRTLEAKIASEFKARTWSALAAQITSAIRDRLPMDGAGDTRGGVPNIRLGSYYSFARNDVTRLRRDLVSGEPLRTGNVWHTPESWGCWTSSAAVELALRIAHAGAVRCFVGVKGLPGLACRITLTVDDGPVIEVPIASSETKWLSITVTGRPEVARIGVRSDLVQNLALVTDGTDNRVVGPGLVGLYACAADDLTQRLAFVEAASIGVLVPGALTTIQPLANAKPVDADLGATESASTDSAIPLAPTMLSKLEERTLRPNDTRDEIIILQTSDPERYLDMLAQSVRTTKLYCDRHGYRYESFIGLKRGCLPWHATYNRIDLLMELIDDDFQGWVLYIDADAWISDLDFDLKSYLSKKNKYALIGSPAGNSMDHFWNINIGVVFFNLSNPFTRSFIVQWERFLSNYDLSRHAKEWNKEIADDQGMFHQILDKLDYAAELIFIEEKEFLNSPWASFVRQAIRAENAGFAERLALMTQEIDATLSDDPKEELPNHSTSLVEHQ